MPSPDKRSSSGRRPRCKSCSRPLTHCLCEFIVRRNSRYRVLILQDPKESRHAMSTAPLLVRSISSSQLIVGEHFDPVTLLGAGWRSRALLLFPGSEPAAGRPGSDVSIDTLVILDGTWRKVARLMHLNPWLGELPKLSLSPQHESRYRIRKSPRVDGLSTIEAAVAALNALEPDQCYDELLVAFHKMIDMQLDAMGADLAKSRYGKE